MSVGRTVLAALIALLLALGASSTASARPDYVWLMRPDVALQGTVPAFGGVRHPIWEYKFHPALEPGAKFTYY